MPKTFVIAVALDSYLRAIGLGDGSTKAAQNEKPKHHSCHHSQPTTKNRGLPKWPVSSPSGFFKKI